MTGRAAERAVAAAGPARTTTRRRRGACTHGARIGAFFVRPARAVAVTRTRVDRGSRARSRSRGVRRRGGGGARRRGGGRGRAAPWQTEAVAAEVCWSETRREGRRAAASASRAALDTRAIDAPELRAVAGGARAARKPGVTARGRCSRCRGRGGGRGRGARRDRRVRTGAECLAANLALLED